MIRMNGNAARGLSLATALGIALALVYPTDVVAFSVEGGALRLPFRDVRVFDNFTNAEANDNTTPDPDFPGAVGATLAIWKATVEWGSELHGDGNGDPTQPGGLGSGGANFDPSWQGAAANPGRTNDNTFSAISGASVGVFAFTELPIEDGWRIRFYQGAAIWEDGPNDFGTIAGHMDIQGVAAHEFGHALGLFHSTDPNATMFATAVGSMEQARSIESDDIAGVQSIYGVKSPVKPHVATYALANHTLTITGSSFSPTGNEVWFTNGAAPMHGEPLKIGPVDSTAGGTEIVIALPALAAPGDLLVKNAGDGFAALSNAYPFDPTANPCPGATVYGTPKTTSIGTSPALFVSGSTHAITNDFVISTAGGIPNATCVLFWGPAAASTPWMGGTLYVDGPYQRQVTTQLDFFGGAAIAIPIDATMIGATRYFQLWFQDAGDAFGVGLTNGVSATFCP
jgi:hypothetical protein